MLHSCLIRHLLSARTNYVPQNVLQVDHEDIVEWLHLFFCGFVLTVIILDGRLKHTHKQKVH